MRYKVINRIIDNRKIVGYRVIGDDEKTYNFSIEDMIEKVKSGLVVNMSYNKGFKGVGLDLRRIPSVNIDNNKNRDDNDKSNHELAKIYENKSKLIGNENLVLEYGTRDRVRLVMVVNKNDVGRLVIPSFITDIKTGALARCKYTEIYVDNRAGRSFNANNLCKDMLSTKIKLGFKNPKDVVRIDGLFGYCTELEYVDISGLDTSKIKNISGMFGYCSKLKEIDLSHLDLSNVAHMGSVFCGCESLREVKLDKRIKNVVNKSNMFRMCKELRVIDLDGIDISRLYNMINMFSDCYNLKHIGLDVVDNNKIKNRRMQGLFWNCRSLKSVDLSKVDTSKVTDMSGMFSGCVNLTNINTSNFNTENVEYTREMFDRCVSLKSIDMSNWDMGKVEDMGYMFSGCSSLSKVVLKRLDLTSAKDMSYMFSGCENLESIGIRALDLKNVRHKFGIFLGTKLKVEGDANKVIIK